MAARELGFGAVAAAAARREPKGVGRRLNRGRGSPWRVRQGDGRRGVAWPDSGSSPSRAQEEGDGPDKWGPPIGGREEGARAGPGRGNWAGGKEERKKGRAEILGRKQTFFIFFPNSLKQIQIKFKLKEFEFKLNHKHLKQCKVAWMHNNKTISFNFIKPTNHYLFLLNSLWRKINVGKFLKF